MESARAFDAELCSCLDRGDQRGAGTWLVQRHADQVLALCRAMVRDLETAEIAVEAALTGHLLFSTIHTNDAATTVTRFLEMGIEPFMISSSMLCACAQRLMRRLCKCKVQYEPDETEKKLAQIPPDFKDPIFKKKGCNKCNGSGYKGRTGTHELLVMCDEIRELINKRATAQDIKIAAVLNGMKTLHDDSMLKVRQGITSIEEALRVVKVDEHMPKVEKQPEPPPPTQDKHGGH